VIRNDDTASVASRYIFYNNSWFDGDDTEANAADDDAIATDKTAYRPEVMVQASFQNYTSYSRGINGIMVDILNATAPLLISASDFLFLVGNDNTPAGWTAAPAPLSVTVRLGAGDGGSDRVTITWADDDPFTPALETGAISKQWLQVTVQATANTGLAAADVHYWGNAIGETGDNPNNAFVDATDIIYTRDNPHNFLNRAPIDDVYDFNRDTFVDATDIITTRDNATNFLNDLNLIIVPVPPAAVPRIAGALAAVRAHDNVPIFPEPKPVPPQSIFDHLRKLANGSQTKGSRRWLEATSHAHLTDAAISTLFPEGNRDSGDVNLDGTNLAEALYALTFSV
jgi:hypothetical protein